MGALTTEVAHFIAVEDRAWADQLLPKTSLPGGSLSAAPPHSDRPALPGPDLNPAASPQDDSDEWPLKGVRYSALIAPGPTGTRPEHLKELLGVRQRTVANRLVRALCHLHSALQKGILGSSARWRLRTRLVWLKKKTGRAPRPVKIGEVLRTSFAKRLARKGEAVLRPKLAEMHQWGLAMPGGAEAMVHWRNTLEELATSGVIPPLVALDLDCCNMFGSLEWPSIRDAVARHFPDIQAWTEWAHQQPAETLLPGGDTAATDRGAEQGDPFGTAQSVLTLGNARSQAHTYLQIEVASLGQGVCDEWFVDDGQALV